MIPPLPDDLLLLILDDLSLAERQPLAESCKRFRHLDFELGKRTFEHIAIDWNSEGFRVNFTDDWSYERARTDQSTSVSHSKRLLRNGTTNWLHISIDKKDVDQDDLILLLGILTTLKIHHLNLKFIRGNVSSGDFIATMIGKVIDVKRAKICLSWNRIRSTHKILRTRRILMNLPKIVRIELNSSAESDPNPKHESLINDELLFHFISQSKTVALGRCNCTARDIERAFELVRQSTVFKCIKFRASTSEVGKFTATAGIIFRRMDNFNPAPYRYDDRISDAMLDIYWDDAFSTVSMVQLKGLRS